MLLRDVINALAILRTEPSLRGLQRCSREPYEPGDELPWWADNLGHFSCGVAIGMTLAQVTNKERARLVYLLLAGIWEAFEYTHGVRPWDPRERREWPTDRAVEDTLLDTLMGYYGVLCGYRMASR